MSHRLMRAFDVVVAVAVLGLLSPVLAAVAVAVRLTSPGPVIYRAERVGLDGRIYTMHKFRTMAHRPEDCGPRITAVADERILPLGRFLRRTKLDELPALWDVLRGEMALVGPRPEDPAIVARHYTEAMLSTLAVRPGLTSPGTLWGAVEGEALLDGAVDPVATYVERVLPLKLALEQVYVKRKSLVYDLWVLGRTLKAAPRVAAGGGPRRDLPELGEAVALIS